MSDGPVIVVQSDVFSAVWLLAHRHMTDETYRLERNNFFNNTAHGCKTT
jgi:hypothetical protein